MEIKNPSDTRIEGKVTLLSAKIEKQREAKKSIAIFSTTDFRLARYFYDREVEEEREGKREGWRWAMAMAMAMEATTTTTTTTSTAMATATAFVATRYHSTN